MTDGPWDTAIALLGMIMVTVYALSKGAIDIAYAGTTALAAYLGSKALIRQRNKTTKQHEEHA